LGNRCKKENYRLKKLETELEEIKNNRIYENAFEWRFEFPEVLNNDGDFVGFDVVIGNPPYFILTKNSFDNNLLSVYISEFESLKKASSKNIFTLFIEKSIQLLRKSGNLSMIVPEGLFETRSYSGNVDFINKNGSTVNITTIEGMVFDEANTGNVIFVFEKGRNQETKLFNFNLYAELEQITKTKNQIIEKVFNEEFNTLNKVCTLFKGMVVQDRREKLFEKSENLPDKFILGNCISKWRIEKYFFTDYSNLTIIGGTKLKSKHDYFPRIVIRRTGNNLCCAYLESPCLTESTLYSCWSKDPNLKNEYILGLLHSKLFDYILKRKMITNPQAFPQILMTDLENLPIIISNSDEFINVFNSKVQRVLLQKRQNPTADTSALEAEIDQMVYRLYGLTEEEIKIVENG
jgi:adenine-specific DNA-methyltransferase